MLASEHNEQAAFVDWVRYQFRNDTTFQNMLFFSVPSGMKAGGNPGRTANKQKSEGWHEGIPDILYLQARGVYAYFAMEFKRSDKRNVRDGGLSEGQQEFFKQAKAVGAFCCVAYTADEAAEFFGLYMGFDSESGRLLEGDYDDPIVQPRL